MEVGLNHYLVVGGILRVGTVPGMSGPTGEVRSFRMFARDGPVCYAITVHVDIAIKFVHRLKIFRRQNLAFVRLIIIVPLEIRTHPVIHSDIEVRHHHDWRLQAIRKIKCGDRHVKAFFGIGRKQQHVLDISMRRIRAYHEITLLRTRWHAGRRTSSLHIENDGRQFSVVGETEEFTH